MKKFFLLAAMFLGTGTAALAQAAPTPVPTAASFGSITSSGPNVFNGSSTFPSQNNGQGVMFGTAGTDTLGIFGYGTNTGAGGTAQLLAYSGQSVNGVPATCLGDYHSPPGGLFSFDCSGNFGLTGYAIVGGYVQGNTLISKANGSLGAYVPPLYNSSGIAETNTTHSTLVTCSATANSSCSVTLSGQAVFTSATSYGCTTPSAYTFPSTNFAWETIGSSTVLLVNNTSSTITMTSVCTGY